MNLSLKSSRRYQSKARDLMRRKQRAAKFAQSHSFLIGDAS